MQTVNKTAFDLAAYLQEAREQAASAKSLTYFAEEEACRAKESARKATGGTENWKVSTPGFRGVLEVVGLAEACMVSAGQRARNAEARAKEAYQALAVLESLLFKMQQGVSNLD